MNHTKSVLIFALSVFASSYGLCVEKAPKPWPPERTPDPNVQKPALVQRVEPIYPREAKNDNLEDEIYVAFVVNTKGEVMRPRVFFSRHEIFERPALDAVRRWKFSPALMKGHPVMTRMIVPIVFRVPKE